MHPGYQKKLIDLLAEYSSDRQIIISTHSPYFISWEAIINGGEIVRVVKEENGSIIYQLSDESLDAIENSLENINNPHTYGLTANEIFFLNENVILVEGLEDVVVYKKILKNLGIELQGEFFGWGVGGADNMKNIAAILKDLGFKKITGLLDANKANLIPQLIQDFPDFNFISIPLDDVRDKKATKAKDEVSGLATTDGKVKPDNKQVIEDLFTGINEYFSGKNDVIGEANA